MSDSASSSTSPSDFRDRELSPDFCAVLVLDGQGRVTAANATARQLWQTSDASLVGEWFASLFAFEVVSTDPDFIQAQWDVLLGSARDGELTLTIQPQIGVARDVHVRLEPQTNTAGGYIAVIRPSAVAVTTGATAPAPHRSDPLTTEGAIGFFDLNFKTGQVQFSPTWKRLLGYLPAELPDTLETWHALIHPDDSAAAPDRAAKKAGPGTRPFNIEFRMKHQRGHWAWIQCAGVQILDEQRVLERVVGIHLDITERKELEDTLVANDARLQDLSSDTGPLAAFELDFVNQAFWFSPAFEKLFGHAAGTLPPTPESFATLLPEDDALAAVEAWFLAFAPGQSAFVEPIALRSRSGETLPLLLGAHRSMTRKRELLRVVGFVCPLPADARVDQNPLPTSLNAAALDALAEALILTDARGKILHANAAAARLLRGDASGLRGQLVGDVLRLVQRQSRHAVDHPFERALAADRPLPLIADDALVLTADQPLIPIVWTARAIRSSDAALEGVVIVFRNPDEMTLSPEELVKANRFESLGLLAGGIAHDFNNLLTTILGAVSLARDSRDPSALADAEKACLTAKGLTKQLLAFAKGGAGTRTVCGVREILDDSIKIASAGSEAEITLHVAEGTDPVLVERGQILQVFQNLIINALQAMPPPPHRARLQIRAANVTLADDQVPALAAGGYVECEVRDNGTGIKPEDVEKIFDPFFTTKKHGTGLGLATVLSIVRKHGGQIGLDTQLGVGTAFTVYLPKADQPVEIQARRAASLRFGTGRVLFMDDDPNISALTGRMLESLDYKYDLAKNGEEAIALYKRYQNIGRPYDAVIMDLTVIGGMGGEECFNELKKLDPDVRAIVASGYDNDDIARKFLEQGFCGYLTKPYRVTDLGKVLKTVLG